MRKILFRGKNKYIKSGWCFGYYYEKNDTKRIRNDCQDLEIDIKTLGQFTGLTDKNGIKIFEGDIVRGKDFGGLRREGSVNFDKEGAKYVIVPNTISQYREHNITLDLCPAEDYLEIIGNVYDNKELLEENK